MGRLGPVGLAFGSRCAPVPASLPGRVDPGAGFINRDAFAFSSLPIGLGRVSLLTGNSIFPRIFGPSNFSALIFSMVGPVSSSQQAAGNGAGGATTSATGSAGTSFFLVFASWFGFCNRSASSAAFSSFFLAVF
jgi:hypothetical protein